MEATFYGFELDTSDILVSAIHFAPTKDVRPGEIVPVGRGYAFAISPVKAGERGTFYVAGNFIIECDPAYSLSPQTTAALDFTTGFVVPVDAPNAFGRFDIELISRGKKGERDFAIGYFTQSFKD